MSLVRIKQPTVFFILSELLIIFYFFLEQNSHESKPLTSSTHVENHHRSPISKFSPRFLLEPMRRVYRRYAIHHPCDSARQIPSIHPPLLSLMPRPTQSNLSPLALSLPKPATSQPPDQNLNRPNRARKSKQSKTNEKKACCKRKVKKKKKKNHKTRDKVDENCED